MQKAFYCTLLISIGLLGACDPFNNNQASTSSTAGSIAVVNLEQVAQAIGQNKLFEQKMQEVQEQTTKQLDALKQQFNQQIQEKQKSLGEKPTPAQRQELINLSTQLQQQYRQGLAQAQELQGRTQVNLIGEFRRKIKPVAQKIAQDQGYTVVLIRSEVILVAIPAVDITTQVIAQLQQVHTSEKSPLNFGQSLLGTPTPGSAPESAPAVPTTAPAVQ